MIAQNQLTVQLAHLFEAPREPRPTPAGACEINVRVADGWAITGHYQNHTLQAVTLHRTPEPEGK